ncbi:SDR family NAD(P)-dependent oxidoreductase [Paraburkholderia sp. EG287B]|uniref:SDR family NAD(P)-dependent oxidoreductase n=1 Tax=Paraburkholderia sp. EG287B TaxID=3237010 RepID=UPI0034D204D8
METNITHRTTRTNERVLIVGGSSGMGFALAKSLLEDGAQVIIAGRSHTRLAEAKQRLPHAHNVRTEARASSARLSRSPA